MSLTPPANDAQNGVPSDRLWLRSELMGTQVITESGRQLGRVLGFAFDIETGELTTLVMGALGVPLLGEGVLSTWEMPVEEIVSSGPDRIIVYEGAEDKLKQLNSGVLEKLGVGGPSWEEQERERYRVNLVPVENQLSSGQPAEEEQRRLTAADTARFEPEEDMEYVELEERRRDVMPQRRYLDEQPEDPDPLPRRSMPMSRRAMPLQREPMDIEPMDVEPMVVDPMDVEPMEREQPPRRSRPMAADDDLDDPW